MTTLPRVQPRQLSTPGAVVLLVGTALSNVIFGAATIDAPAVASGLGGDVGAAGLFVALFSAGFAAVLVLAGRLGDRWGRRRLFRIGLALLGVTSLAVALAPSLASLLVLRALEGVATGVMLPQTLSTIHTTTQGPRRALLTSVYVAVVGLGTTLGQLGAGALAAVGPAGWRWTFGLIGALALAVCAAGGLILQTRSAAPEAGAVGRAGASLGAGAAAEPGTPAGERGAAARSGLDLIGSLLLAVAVVAFLVPVGLGRGLGWPWWTWASLGVAVLAVLGLVVREPRLEEHRALIPLAAVRSLPLRTGLALTIVFFIGYGGFVFLFSSTFGSVGLTPLAVAAALFPFAVAFVAGTLSAPWWVRRFSAVTVMRTGALVQLACLAVGAGMIWAQWPAPSVLMLQPVLVVQGVAQAVMYTPLLGTVMAALPHHLAGTASGLVATMQQVGLAVGVAVIAVLADVAAGLGGAGVACSLGLTMVMAVVFASTVGRLRRG